MSNLQTITELCKICIAQADIIDAQAATLEQLGAVCAEEKLAEVKQRLSALTGHDETKGGEAR